MNKKHLINIKKYLIKFLIIKIQWLLLLHTSGAVRVRLQAKIKDIFARRLIERDVSPRDSRSLREGTIPVLIAIPRARSHRLKFRVNQRSAEAKICRSFFFFQHACVGVARDLCTRVKSRMAEKEIGAGAPCEKDTEINAKGRGTRKSRIYHGVFLVRETIILSIKIEIKRRVLYWYSWNIFY